jgi:creatinine amidohydrolase
MTWQLGELTWEAFREQVPSKIDTVLLPVGTVEAHGAIPLGTDTLIPTALAADLAPRLRALLAPAIPYGVTNSLLPYPGSMTVSSQTFEAYVFEAVAGLADAGFRKIVLMNGHGGQSREVGQVIHRLWESRRVFSVAIEWWGLREGATREIYGDVVSGHAGVEETAIVLAIAPGLVDEARATTIRRAPRVPGIKARPFPASIILDRAETGSEGAPVLDRQKASAFYRQTLDDLESAIRGVFAGWADLGS